MKKLKSVLTIRGDSVYCPLSFSLDSYGNCLTDCWHCYLRNLNHVWGEDLKPADLDILEAKLKKGPLNKNPRSPLAHCLANKNTIRWGNKTDPFQEAELEYRIAPHIFFLLTKYEWSFVIQTRFTHILANYEKQLLRAHKKGLATLMPVVSPGLDRDWEILERGRTTSPEDRLKYSSKLQETYGLNVGINGEPFIPGYHTVKDFETTLKLLKSYQIKSYNTYNFHFNAFVAKRLHAIGIDIEKIWFYNQDAEWRKILSKLLDLSKKYNITIGCPDFVNSGANWVEKANTCCGVNVPNPTRFNSHHFKQLKQQGLSNEEILKITDDGTGDPEMGRKVLFGEKCNFYTLKDAGFKK